MTCPANERQRSVGDGTATAGLLLFFCWERINHDDGRTKTECQQPIRPPALNAYTYLLTLAALKLRISYGIFATSQ